MSGIVGAFSVVFAKCFVELIVNAAQREAAIAESQGQTDNSHPIVGLAVFLDGRTYGIIIGLGITIGLQLKWLNDGLRRFRSSYVVPIFTSFWITFSVISGLIFFNEYRDMSTLDKGMFAFGLVVTLSGVITLGSIHHLSQAEEHDILHDGQKFEVIYGSESEEEDDDKNMAKKLLVQHPADSEDF